VQRSPITFRLSEKREQEIRQYVERIKTVRPWWGEYTLTDFIKQAIDEKLAHLERSRKAAEKRKKPHAEMKVIPPVLPAVQSPDFFPHEVDAIWGVGT